MNKSTRVAAVTTVAAATLATAPAGATEAQPVEEHCVLQVTGVDEAGAFITDERVCYPTLAEALAEVGMDVDLLDSESARGAQSMSAQSAGTIGIHWDGAGRTGSSITITGADCAGGYLNLSASWINRISSTWNGCPIVRFFDGYDKTGSHETTGPYSENLSILNNASNSISYDS